MSGGTIRVCFLGYEVEDDCDSGWVREIIGQIVRQRLEREPARTAHGST